MSRNCVECGDNIPYKVTIDGKTRNLKNRTKCLKCLPFGCSSYRRKSSQEQRTNKAERMRRWYTKRKNTTGVDPINERKQETADL